jgi:peptidyl-prolyl cis-trans isomerase A (cyclophilin A)
MTAALLLLLLADAAQLGAEDPMARFAAARALGEAGDRKALRPLIDALADAEPFVRVEAARAIVRIGLTKAELRPVILRMGRAEAGVGLLLAEALAGLGKDAVPALLTAIEKDQGSTAKYALAALQFAGPAAASAVPALVDLTADKRPAIKRQAGEALRRLAPWAEGEVGALLLRLRIGNEEQRWLVCTILGRVGPPAKAAIPALEELVQGGSERVKEAASQALKNIAVQRSQPAGERHPALKKPALAREKAPARFIVRFTTTKGDIDIEVKREWSPLGADRFYNLVRIGYFTDTAFFRVVKGFVAQFGLHADAAVSRAWSDANIDDDPVKVSNAAGWIAFAMAGPKTRTTQMFFNLANNRNLDPMGFSPFGRVVKGMRVVKSLYSGYGEKPDQRNIMYDGNKYLKREFPKLDYIKKAEILEPK